MFEKFKREYARLQAEANKLPPEQRKQSARNKLFSLPQFRVVVILGIIIGFLLNLFFG